MCYHLNLEGTVEFDLNIDVVDPSWTIREVIAAWRDGRVEGLAAIDDLPLNTHVWKGDVIVDGNIVAHYQIEHIECCADVDSVYDVAGVEVDVEAEDEVEVELDK